MNEPLDDPAYDEFADLAAAAAPRTDTLLDHTIKGALWDVLDFMDGRPYQTKNLHPFATRAVFSSTDGIENRDLLRLLSESPTVSTKGLDTREIRFRRTWGNDREHRKINQHRKDCVALLRSRGVSNADVVRGWAFVLLHSGALDVMLNASADDLGALRRRDVDSRAVFERLVTSVHGRVSGLAMEYLEDANTRRHQGSQKAAAEFFLDFSAFELLRTMARPGHPTATLGYLLDTVYPEFDAYGDPNE